ncbi:MAG: methyl-accepting chemotaxis protein [Deltaproteobacteria bacterium]|nr:methyl-accepting chemotaxis protein [Deltaproteobacteria bacterium]
MKFIKASEKKMGIGIQGKITGLFIMLLLVAVMLNVVAVSTLGNQKKDGVVINIAGRQRMLSQKMSKEAILLSARIDQDQIRKSLQGTYNLFNKSHAGLVNGSEELNLPRTTEPGILKQMLLVDGLWKEFGDNVKFVLESTEVNDDFRTAVQFITDNNVKLLKEMNKAVTLYEADSTGKVNRLNWILIIGIIFLVVCVFLIYIITLKTITIPIRNVLTRVKGMEDGDLTTRLETNLQDEIGDICSWFNQFLNSMLTMVKEIKDKNNDLVMFSGELNNRTDNLKQISDDIALRTEQQAAALTQTSSTIQQMAATTKSTTQQVQGIKDLANATKNDANHGATVVAEMSQSFSKIEESSQKIGGIIKVIIDIANQTNLLSLNAAIEAAKAGEFGKGFAVVADEVRALAERSNKAVTDIKELIQESTQNIQKGDEMMKSTAENFNNIQSQVDQISEQVNQVSAGILEQDMGVQEISKAAEEIADIGDSNADAVNTFLDTLQAIITTTHEINEVSDSLDRNVSKFHVENK